MRRLLTAGGHADLTLKTSALGETIPVGFDQESAFGLVHESFLGLLRVHGRWRGNRQAVLVSARQVLL